MPNPSHSELEAWKARLARPASRMLLRPAPKGASPNLQSPNVQSWFGRVTHALPGEPWPTFKGKPLWPLAQIVCAELPHRPQALADIALLRVYITPDIHEADELAGEGWCVRASKDLRGLAPAPEPDHGSEIIPHAAAWELIPADFPSPDDAPDDLPDDLVEEHEDLFEPATGLKVGGWPYTVQSEIYWAPWNKHPANPEFVFQVDSESDADWMLGDCGVAYFGRGTGAHRDQWAFTWQCC